ncbi:MAG: phosphatase PAP2 family protein [Desulfatibacillum sp.]|nr:phosphatase PAP2 family protein [Desulfatibacillum sp.]
MKKQHGKGWATTALSEPKALASLALVGCIFATVASLIGGIDVKMASWFYEPGHGWLWAKEQPWAFLHQYGPLPGVGLTLAALGGILASGFVPGLKIYRKPFLVVFLTAVLGSALVVNTVLKPYWGRPRPNQIVEFGGSFKYRPPLFPGLPGEGRSFPCGHATMGFVFVSLVAFRKSHPLLAKAGIIGGLGFGGVLGAARMVEGAHFFSDVVWSGGVMILSAVCLDYFVFKPVKPEAHPIIKSAFWARSLTAILLLGGSMGLVFVFLWQSPYYETHSQGLGLRPENRKVYISLNKPYSHAQVVYPQDGSQGEMGRVYVATWGLGWLKATVALKESRETVGDDLYVNCRILEDGFFSRLNHEITVALPKSMEGRVDLRFIPYSSSPSPITSSP